MILLLPALLWLPLTVVPAPMQPNELLLTDEAPKEFPFPPWLNPAIVSNSGDVLEPLPISPLDGVSDASSTLSNSFSPPGSWFTGKQLADELESLPPCQRECAKDLHDTVGDVLNGGSYVTKYHRTCAAYKEARRCIIEKRDKCDENVEMFAVATSGIKYMCIEQGKAFNASIECIDHNAHQVQGLCEEHCDAKGALMRIFTESSLMNSFGEVFQLLRAESALQPAAFGDSPLPFEPGLLHFGLSPQTGNGMGLQNQLGLLQPELHTSIRDFEVITGNACQVVECSLACMRTKYDIMCDNHAGSLISETLVRPMALGQQRFMLPLLALGMVMPQSCKFLSSGTKLMRLRIEPKTHQNLLRTFGTTDEEEIAHVADAGNNIIPESPINANSDLNALIEEMYANETFVDAEDRVNGTDSSEESTRQTATDDLLTTANITGNTTLDEEQLVEGSGNIKESSGVPEGSGEEQEELGEVVFKSVLSATPSYFEFTANSSGKYITWRKNGRSQLEEYYSYLLTYPLAGVWRSGLTSQHCSSTILHRSVFTFRRRVLWYPENTFRYPSLSSYHPNHETTRPPQGSLSTGHFTEFFIDYWISAATSDLNQKSI
ncbi:hypothetical protein Y032_0031g2350 [Ancylostoma ceylanicum]|uniref:Chondroitin proteoglycan 4 domain-containing protein n=1 Tax=Ancylostoma ceylanicum TaxID=53326 RepID=A0A016UQM9_9BILA|nr:hypothetical protein Y032_0031g2350 [Ancylostoma ceylanicum]